MFWGILHRYQSKAFSRNIRWKKMQYNRSNKTQMITTGENNIICVCVSFKKNFWENFQVLPHGQLEREMAFRVQQSQCQLLSTLLKDPCTIQSLTMASVIIPHKAKKNNFFFKLTHVRDIKSKGDVLTRL